MLCYISSGTVGFISVKLYIGGPLLHIYWSIWNFMRIDATRLTLHVAVPVQAPRPWMWWPKCQVFTQIFIELWKFIVLLYFIHCINETWKINRYQKSCPGQTKPDFAVKIVVTSNGRISWTWVYHSEPKFVKHFGYFKMCVGTCDCVRVFLRKSKYLVLILHPKYGGFTL